MRRVDVMKLILVCEILQTRKKNWAFECFNFHPEMLHVHFRMEIGEIQLLMLPSYIIFSLLALGPIPVILFARFYLFISSRR
jgi:hypothetical protein